eukprot:scaffold7998_cov258-Pinguiococcus_pyrenoidosus.AAC.4
MVREAPEEGRETRRAQDGFGLTWIIRFRVLQEQPPAVVQHTKERHRLRGLRCLHEGGAGRLLPTVGYPIDGIGRSGVGRTQEVRAPQDGEGGQAPSINLAGLDVRGRPWNCALRVDDLQPEVSPFYDGGIADLDQNTVICASISHPHRLGVAPVPNLQVRNWAARGTEAPLRDEVAPEAHDASVGVRLVHHRCALVGHVNGAVHLHPGRRQDLMPARIEAEHGRRDLLCVHHGRLGDADPLPDLLDPANGRRVVLIIHGPTAVKERCVVHEGGRRRVHSRKHHVLLPGGAHLVAREEDRARHEDRLGVAS